MRQRELQGRDGGRAAETLEFSILLAQTNCVEPVKLMGTAGLRLCQLCRLATDRQFRC